MDKTAPNKGDFDCLQHLAGAKIPKAKCNAKKKEKAKSNKEKQFPWGDDWLSVHNDFLFTRI